jgi:hypothetical protein
MAIKKASAAKPKNAVAKKPAAKKTVAKKASAKKSVAKKPVAKVPAANPAEEQVVKVRKPRKVKGTGSSYEIMLKKQSELDAYKKQAKIELKKQYDEKLKGAEELKAHYQKLFGESIGSAPKAGKAGAKKAGKVSRGYTLEQIESFLSQVDAGGKIKIKGKNAAGVARIKAAYDKAPNKDAKSILDIINK